MPHRMRKIVSRCRPPFIGTRRNRHKHGANHNLPEDPATADFTTLTVNEANTTKTNHITLKDSPQIPIHSNNKDYDNQSISSSLNSTARSTTMQNTPSSSNLGAMGTGIVPPPPMHYQLSQYMQSTTPSVANGKDEMRGWLYKWTNYLKGYQKRWFVLQAGVLSYYRSQDEMSHTCRGTVYLESAQLSANESCHFVISNGSTILHLRTNNENDKQRWMNALELAKQKANKAGKQYPDSDEEGALVDDLNKRSTDNTSDQGKQSMTTTDRQELAAMNKTLDAKLDDLKMCMDLINRHYQALHRTLADLEQIDKSDATINTIKSVNERATLFRITSTAMLNACQELVQLIQKQGRKWQKAIQFEHDARMRMERMCEEVASQSAKLEKRIQRASRKDKELIKTSDMRNKNEDSLSSDSDEFHDAESVFRIPLQHHTPNSDNQSANIVDDDVSSYNDEDNESGSEEQDDENLPVVIVKRPKKPDTTNTPPLASTTTTTMQKHINNGQKSATSKRKRRDRILERPNYSINLWSIIKNCVGKDLSKIPIPVNFSEPLSMLQRITEELEYSSVLDAAAKTNDNWEQLAYVAAFTVSSYSTTATRTNKPFNPLLGETFECDRTDDYGWRSMAEQVSHHPPAVATHSEGQGWTLYQEFTMGSKFRGQYLSITPLGYSHLVFKNTGNHFTWKKVTTLVNNIIVGKLWIDNVGEMEIINHTTNDVCKLKFFQYSYFAKDVPHKVTGVITDSNSEARWVLSGTWTGKIEGGPVESNHHHMETHNMKVLWQRKMPPPFLEQMYNFTELAIELNEFEPDVAPTDTRRRPDQRLMEDGRWDEANQEKLRLEEKQRQARKIRESHSTGHDPYRSKWFTKQFDPMTKASMHVFTNEYWRCYDFGQYYSRVRIFEYNDYSDVKLLKFNIYGPTKLANWFISINQDGKCDNYFANIHYDLQNGAYSLIAPRNESFPDTYVTKRHDLIKTVFNRTVSNSTVQLRNPLRGTWFATVFVERLTTDSKSKKSSGGCNFYLTTWLDYQALSVSLTLSLDQPLQIFLSNNTSIVYASYYTSPGNPRLSILSEWLSPCDVTILGRINGLPDFYQYDYQTVCKNGSCVIETNQLSAFVWIYFQISVNNTSCLNNSIRGSLLVQSAECLYHSIGDTCIKSYPTQRVMFTAYYNFLYIPVNRNSNTSSIILNGNDSSIYSYEFIVDDRNIGGTIHLDFEARLKSHVQSNVNVSILGCVSKHQPRRYRDCEIDYRIYIKQSSPVTRSLPYPEIALWYLTLEYICNGSMNDCDNASLALTFQISSSSCTREQCGTYGVCRILTSQQNIFSVCTCIAGYRGYGCTDSSYSYASKYLPSVLFLTLSNLMFIPAIIVAIYYHLYIEALVYFFNMFFSTFYHACDQGLHKFCMFKYDGLQLSDFIGSYSSFVITLITLSIVPRAVKVFLFVLGLLVCVTINSRDRFDNLQFIGLISITFSFTIVTWVTVSIKKRRLQPSLKRLLWITPGLVLAIIGLVLFVVVETEDNYWYIHSLWHILMATSILFFIPKKIEQNRRQIQTSNLEPNEHKLSTHAVNRGATLLDEE
ncbi:unnamed protein product [Rotaria socialis]